MKTIYRTGFPFVSAASGDSLEAAARLCLAWVVDRQDVEVQHRALPKSSLRTIPETPIGAGNVIEARLINRDNGRAWAMRYTHPHRDGSHTDPAIQWQTDIGVAERGDDYTFHCSVYVGRTSGGVVPVRHVPTRPKIVREMLNIFKCGGAIRLSDKAYVIKDESDDAELFLDLLESSSRQLPVVFVTPRATGEYVADYKAIASELAGLAYVVVAKNPYATRLLDDRLPKQLNCFDGGVRIYWPEFSVSQAPYRHPLWQWWRIQPFKTRRQNAFAKQLLKQISAVAVLSFHPDWFSWAEAEAHDRSQAIARAKSADDKEQLLKVFEEENRKLEEDKAQLRRELQLTQQELKAAQQKISAYELAFEERKQKSDQPTDAPTPIPPKTVAEAVEEAKRLYADRLVFALNAKSDVDENPFEEPEKFFQALSWLANDYHDSKTGKKKGTTLNDSIKRTLQDWFYSGGQSDHTVGQYRNWYCCKFEERTWVLGEHIGTGISRDARHTIRIGFTWDKTGQRVIIGYIGQHQRNRRT